MHIAFSASIKGAGIVAGGPYDCATQTTYTSCMYLSIVHLLLNPFSIQNYGVEIK
jgi:hypothetical protein